MIFRVERKERARLKNVKFHGRGADAKGVSTVLFLLTVANHVFFLGQTEIININ